MKTWKTSSGHEITRLLSGRSNVFLLSNGTRYILIDTSPGRRWKKLSTRLRQKNIGHLEALVLTHSHFDHSGSAYRIKQKFGCPVIIQESEANNLKTGKMSIPGGTNPFARFLVNCLLPYADKIFRAKPCEPDITVDEAFDLGSFGFNAKLIHTPGHSPGSMSIIADNEVAIVGDTMFGIFKWSILPPFANDINELKVSWDKLLQTGCTVFLPSHGGSKTRDQLMNALIKRNAR